MPSFWIVILFLYKICSAEAVGNSEPSIVSVKAGEPVTLNCKSALTDKTKTALWFKLRLEHKPQEVGYKFGIGKEPVLQNPFKNSTSGFQLKEAGSGFSLSIKSVQKEDEGIYFCGSVSENSVTFSTGTFLAVSDPSDISVLQTPALQGVPPGEAVNLQCRVLSEIRSAELRVFWIRSATGSSFPEIIYTHHDSSSRQCEISSSKHSCVYNFSTNIPNNHHAATYYCAVQTCGRIIIENRTPVYLSSAEAVGNSELSIVSVKAGEPVTLNCKSALTDKSKYAYWFKLRLEHKPREVGYKFEGKDPVIQNPFKNSTSGFQLKKVGSGLSLSIKSVQKEDEGIYFCGSISENSVTFSTGTFLAVSDPSDISVLQTPALQWVPPGEAVNLQCRVLSEIRSAELRVFWIRSAAESSFPEIIYTHHNSSSRQCESSSSKHSCVYDFSTNIPNNHHAATYYCAVQTCGRIIIGNGTAVYLKSDPRSVLIVILALALGLSLFCNIVSVCWSRTRGNCSGETSQSVLQNLPEVLQAQDDDEEFYFTALNSSDKKTGKVFEENVFTKVRFTPFTYDKPAQ